MMYKTASQKVLLYGSKIWVVTGVMLKILEGFHHWVARQIAGMVAKCVVNGKQEYPLVAAALEAAGLY